jgi:hypothetical protein
VHRIAHSSSISASLRAPKPGVAVLNDGAFEERNPMRSVPPIDADLL